MEYTALIVAGGKGERVGLGYNKLLYKINEKTILEYAIEPFLKDDECKQIIVSTNDRFDIKNTKIIYTKSGKSRSETVKIGLQKVMSEYVMIHDGARCNLNIEFLIKIKKELKIKDACFLSSKITDTIYTKDFALLNRENIIKAQTPQAFKTKLIKKVYEQKIEATDDISAFLTISSNVSNVESDETNFKITNLDDIKYFQYIKNNLK